MILYHGTSTASLDRILDEGLLPTHLSGHTGNWEGAVQSKPFVYLSSAYAIYYAVNACAEDHDPALIKVQVSEEELFPEEDYIAWHHSDGSADDWRKEISETDPSRYKASWADSLGYCGNVCTPFVSPGAILDHRIIPMQENLELLLNTGFDAIPAERNFQVMGNYYKRCLEAYFAYELNELPGVVAALYDGHQRSQFGDEIYSENAAAARKADILSR